MTFGADAIAEVPAPISITDDEVDEAHHQYFIVLLELIDAVNRDLITITRQASIGDIVDNDGQS